MENRKMNEMQVKLFNDLMTLTNETEAFYKTVVENHEGGRYFIFLYHFASYTDFCLDGALESRGITFLVDEQDNPISLVSMPMEKFFNFGENDFTIGSDHQSFEYVMIKEDGSLISSYLNIQQDLRLKTKGSLKSDQAIDAMAWLSKDENKEFQDAVLLFTEENFTVNKEWTSPLNRIVIEYDKPSLIVLNVRNNATGEYVSREQLERSVLAPYLVKFDDEFYSGKTLDELRGINGIEGWVVVLKGHTHLDNPVRLAKLKTSSYVALHHTKDSINSSKALFAVVLEEASDDLKQMFETDGLAIKRILLMEAIVEEHFNHISTLVEFFYSKNKYLDRKDFSLLGQKEMGKYFHLAMSLYLGRGISVKEYMLRSYKEFTTEFEEKFPDVVNET